MISLEIRPLTRLDREYLRELMSGYVTTQRYAVQKQETDAVTTFTLTLQPLPQPYSKNYWDSLSEDDLRHAAAQRGLPYHQHSEVPGAQETQLHHDLCPRS